MSGIVSTPRLQLGQCATNVHRGADFEDLTLHDFLVSAVAIAPAIDGAPIAGIGLTVLEAITATRQLVSTNTNLGIVLLVAPLAAVTRERPLTTPAVHDVLAALTSDDARCVYEAIRLAQPGGLGKVQEMDVADQPPQDLLAAMRAAADRDLVARQYVEDFRLVLDDAMPRLVAGCQRGWTLTDAIIHTHLDLVSRHGDSLIARKCGPAVAEQTAAMAGQVLDAGGPGDESYLNALADFDFWLRANGHRRNPGTTADLIAAGLFAALRDGLLTPPYC
jgi:triphosphoribosyl-dephospho-CoA synthase